MSKNNETYKSKNVIRAHISELTFNNGEKLEIRANDIVLFVGPNNVGKSQSLKDIFSRCGSNSQTIVISDLSIIKEGESLRPLLDTISKGQDSGVVLCQDLKQIKMRIFQRKANVCSLSYIYAII